MIVHGDVEDLRGNLDEVDVDARSSSGENALHVAVRLERDEMIAGTLRGYRV